MVASLLLRGMLVGVIAGLLAFGFARVFGEPPLAQAIAFEEHASQGQGTTHEHASADAHEHSHEQELVSRATQAGLGLFTGVVVYSAAIGGLFALVFAFVYGRVGRLGPRATAALLALAGFVAVALIPGLKYPANPPAVGEAETIGLRTGLFFVMLLISVAAMVCAAVLARHLAARYGAWNGGLMSCAAFVAVIAVAFVALPEVNEVPPQFSASVLWQFRLASFGMQAVLWITLGLLFGALTERSRYPGPSAA